MHRTMGSATADAIVATPGEAGGIRRLQRRSMAAAVRGLRHQRRVESGRNSASVSRLAAAAIHARAAGDAVVPEQADHPPVDAIGVARRGAPPKESHGYGEPRFHPGPRVWTAPAGAVAGS